MYNPSQRAEFIELTNIGATPLLLEGAYFDDGKPFDRFTFGAYTLAPGAFIVVTNDIHAFETMYGFGMVAIAGQFQRPSRQCRRTLSSSKMPTETSSRISPTEARRPADIAGWHRSLP
jgi:hypothetical protein